MNVVVCDLLVDVLLYFDELVFGVFFMLVDKCIVE